MKNYIYMFTSLALFLTGLSNVQAAGADTKDAVTGVENEKKELTDRTLAFMKALSNKDFKQAHQLLKKGIDVNLKDKHKFTPIYNASWAGDEAIVEELIKKGADLNAYTAIGNYPIHAAARQGHKNIVKMLINAGANIHVTGAKNETSIDQALEGGHEDIAAMLRNLGVKGGTENIALLARKLGDIVLPVKTLQNR